MKQYVKSLQKDGDCFKYLCTKFPKLSEAKLKEGVFTGPDIRKLLTDPSFVETMNEKEKEAWVSFKDVVRKFLGNTKDPNYKTIVQRMLAAYEAQGCKMSLKVHFLNSHIDYFPENLGAYSEEQGCDFTRMSVISTEGTKGDGMSLCLLTTVGCLSEKLKMEIGKGLVKVSRKRRRGFIKNMNKYMYQNNVSFA